MMEIRVFTHPVFRRACSPEKLAELVKSFKDYKKGLTHPANFGRDEAYDRPPSVRSSGLKHIHLQDASSKRWHLKYMRLFDKVSNTALVYCVGFQNENHFLLLDVLEDAHSYYKGGQQHILYLAELADEFRNKY